MAQETDNTNIPSPDEKKQDPPAVRWLITYGKIGIDPKSLISPSDLQVLLSKQAKKYVFQLERGDETGFDHYHIYVELKKKQRMTEIKKWIGDFPHLDKIKNTRKDIDRTQGYCQKIETRMEGPWFFNLKAKYQGQDLPKKEDLYPWQKEILEICLSTNSDRLVHWYWEPTGGVGKSTFAKYLAWHHGDTVCVTTASKSADILTCANENYQSYVFDFPRTLGPTFCPFNAIEQLKNGMISDAKLKKECRNIITWKANVVIFSNHPPDTDKLSSDKWRIVELRDTLG